MSTEHWTDRFQGQAEMYGELSDADIATKVRMLGRNDLDHEPVVQAARDRIARLSRANRDLTADNERLTRELGDAKDRVDILEKELDELAAFTEQKHPIGQVKGIGLRECVKAVKEVVADLEQRLTALAVDPTKREELIAKSYEFFKRAYDNHSTPAPRWDIWDAVWKNGFGLAVDAAYLAGLITPDPQTPSLPEVAELERQLAEATKRLAELTKPADEEELFNLAMNALNENYISGVWSAYFIKAFRASINALAARVTAPLLQQIADLKAGLESLGPKVICERTHYDSIIAAHDRLAAELDEATGYLSRLFKAFAPECNPFDHLSGLCTQIDNCMVGMRDELALAEEACGQLSDMYDAERESHINNLANYEDQILSLDKAVADARGELAQAVNHTDGVYSSVLQGLDVIAAGEPNDILDFAKYADLWREWARLGAASIRAAIKQPAAPSPAPAQPTASGLPQAIADAGQYGSYAGARVDEQRFCGSREANPAASEPATTNSAEVSSKVVDEAAERRLVCPRCGGERFGSYKHGEARRIYCESMRCDFVGTWAEVEAAKGEGDLKHGMNCPALGDVDDAECTCGLEWRKRLATEQEMHAAWRKRAEEAEQQLAAANQAREADNERWRTKVLELERRCNNEHFKCEAAEQRVERLQRLCNDHVAEIEQHIKRADDLRQELDREHEILRQQNYWRWQGDGYDYPESLTCQVVMTAEQLRELLQRAERAEAANVAMRETIAWISRVAAPGSGVRDECERILAAAPGRAANELRALREAETLLAGVYSQAGNGAPAEYRHVLTPRLRDDIRDWLKSRGHFDQALSQGEQRGEGQQ